MPRDEDDRNDRSVRRGLLVPTIQRGTAALLAIRGIRAVRRTAWLALQLLVAIIILFEEWGWQPLAAGLARLARLSPVARLEAAVAGLSPWPALCVFLVPWGLFLPLKLMAFWLIAGGHLIWATALFIFAKIAGTALYARIFQLTQPALMQMAWFAAAYERFVGWKDALVDNVRSTAVWQMAATGARRGRVIAGQVWRVMRPVLDDITKRIREIIGR